jgi:tRNA threonylcarbamoyladenosine biosynthesis protein TsaB
MNFRCLAIETATDLMSLAACNGERRAIWESRPAREETQHIFRHAEEILAEAGTTLGELDCVAFGCGPGSFTGVRMAAAATQALAFALAIPVCRRSSLAVLAAGAVRSIGAGLVATCLDARMEHAYFALYRADPHRGVVPVIADVLIEPQTFVITSAEPFFAAGPGWRAYPGFYARHSALLTGTDEQLLPSSRDLLSMAALDYKAGVTIAAETALPEYLGLAPVTAA